MNRFAVSIFLLGVLSICCCAFAFAEDEVVIIGDPIDMTGFLDPSQGVITFAGTTTETTVAPDIGAALDPSIGMIEIQSTPVVVPVASPTIDLSVDTLEPTTTVSVDAAANTVVAEFESRRGVERQIAERGMENNGFIIVSEMAERENNNGHKSHEKK